MPVMRGHFCEGFGSNRELKKNKGLVASQRKLGMQEVKHHLAGYVVV